MDSELTSIASVKALNQGVATTDSPAFAGLDVTGTGNLGTIGNGALNAAAALGFQSNRAFFGYSSSQSALIQSGASKGVVVEVNSDTLDSGTRAALFASNGDVSFYEDTGTTAKLTWSASEEALTVGGELKLKYTGSASLISGGDALRLRATNEIKIQNFNSTETLAQFIPAGAATLNYAGSPKIATTSTGIDVTGTATMDGLTVEAASNALIRISDSTSSNQRLDLQHNSGVASIISGNNGAYGVIKLQAYNGTDTVERMRIDSSGQVGIGTSSPASTLHVNSDTTALQLTNSATGSAATDGFQIRHFSSSSGFVVIDQKEAAGVSFQIAGSERGRFASTGHWCVGRTGTSAGAEENGIVLNPDGIIITAKNNTNNQTHINFVNNAAVTATTVGTIKTSGSATSYNTSSDYRLKTDAQPMTGATARLKALNPVNFEWIADGTRVDGFLAHEAQEVVPECVSGEKDAMQEDEYEVTPAVLDEEGNTVEEAVMGTRTIPDYQGIDQSKLVPLLVATIQELEARITQLENS